MVGQVEAVLEALATAWTRVGLESSVTREVAPQVRAVAEALATLTAVKRDAGGRRRAVLGPGPGQGQGALPVGRHPWWRGVRAVVGGGGSLEQGRQ